jgi:hypothetical protein
VDRFGEPGANKPVSLDREFLVAEEMLLVRNSGEIPEVAFHGSLYYLTADPEGPGLALSVDERGVLEEQVLERYREIIRRDLTPENRDRAIYRGLARAAVNWRRLAGFCHRTAREADRYRSEAGLALRELLTQEIAEVRSGRRRPSINCTAADLTVFAGELGLSIQELPLGWQELCSL